MSLQFYVTADYSITVEGVIELTNTSGKDLSLTQYDMNLPYFTLRNTKIGYIYPKAFLVDMYSQSNSILFTFKSLYTRPVVVGKNGKITFTFSADVEKPYRDLGGLRTLSFPFMLEEENRKVSITVTVNDQLTLLSAPNVATQLKERSIFPVTDATGKLFLFGISPEPLSLTFSHKAEVPLPPFLDSSSCIDYQPTSCIGCETIKSIAQPQRTYAIGKKDSNTTALTFSRTIDTQCMEEKYKKSTTHSETTAGSKIAGFLISPVTQQLIPAHWQTQILPDGASLTSNIATAGVPTAYTESLGLLTIPLYPCNSDDECIQFVNHLRTVETSLSTTPEITSAQLVTTTEQVLVGVTQQGRNFEVVLNNPSEHFVSLASITLQDNPFFTLQPQPSYILPPGSTTKLQLETRKRVQTSNQETLLTFLINEEAKPVTFKPITITVLLLVELLSYLFLVVVVIFFVSSLTIFLYNKRNAKSHVPQKP